MIRKLLLSMGVLALLPAQAFAAPLPATQFAACQTGLPNFLFIQPWYACLERDSSGGPKIDELNDLLWILFPILEALVKIAAYVAVGVIFFMIIKMVTARGDSGKIASAGIGIRDAVIGLIIALSSIAIVNFIVSGITRT